MTTPAQPELKPCPFCGCSDALERFPQDDTERIACGRCQADGPYHESMLPHEVGHAWNRRATEPAEPKGYDPLRTAKMLCIAADALDLLQGVLQKGALTEDDEGAIWELDQDMGDAIIRGASDLDRAWAWFRDSAAGLGRNAALEAWECWIVGECYGTGPTKSAAVLAAWRAAMGREEDQ